MLQSTDPGQKRTGTHGLPWAGKIEEISCVDWGPEHEALYLGVDGGG